MRTDIQALRGLAVLAVLLFHAKIGLPGGYLGVDVFFVISGYLMTRMIVGGVDRGEFSFAQFYFRRAKRLLPAAYCTFFVTLLAAPFLLTSMQLEDFKWELVGALTFSANMVLLSQVNYFGWTADLKPLLHIWSLSLEEQFYFVLPALLVFTPRRFWKPVAITLVLVSLGACVFVMSRRPPYAFYLLPTRAWELGIGCIGALVAVTPRWAPLVRLAFYPALLALVGLQLLPWKTHPGPVTLAICVATMLVILRAHGQFFSGRIAAGLARVGDFSYSLYLVHWPLFAFLNNAWIGDLEHEPPLALRVAMLAAAFALGWLQYRFVEEPCRRAQWKLSVGTVARAVTASLAMLAIFSATANAVASKTNYANLFRPAIGLSTGCEFGNAFEQRVQCRNSEEPEVLVWGDSFASHLVPGIAADAKMAQATRSMCAPFLGIAVVDAERPVRLARGCMAFNDSVVQQLRAMPSVKTVVLSSPLAYLLVPGATVLRRISASDAVVPASQEVLMAALEETARAVRAAGKRVVLVAPAPTGNFDVARCIEQRETGRISIGVHADCDIPVQRWKHERQAANDFVAMASASYPVVDASRFLCDERVCRTTIGGVPIYRDDAHLSNDGSVRLAHAMGLVELIRTQAR